MSEDNKTTETGDKGNSIVDPKYRERYKNPDWLGKLIGDHASTKVTKTRNVKSTDKDGKETITKESYETDGPIDVDKLMQLAKENNIDTAKYEAQRENNGFPGRFRMTLRNILQARVKRSHGLFVDGEWVAADAAWLEAKQAPEEPTHDRDGSKFAKVAKVEDAVKAEA